MRHRSLWATLLAGLCVVMGVSVALAQDTTPVPNTSDEAAAPQSQVLAPGSSIEAVTGAADASTGISTAEVPFSIEEPGHYALTIARTTDSGEILQVVLGTQRGAPVELRYSFSPNAFADDFWLPGDYVLTISASEAAVPVRLTLEASDGNGLGASITETVVLTPEEGAAATHEASLEANTIITVRAIRLGADVDPVLTMLDADGTTLARVDDVWQANDLMANSFDSLLSSFVVPADGTYTFSVSLFSGFGAGDVLLAITQYGTVANGGSPVVDEEAASLVEGGQFTRTIEVQAGEYVRISAIADDISVLDPVLEVRDADGVLLARNDDHNNATDAQLDTLDSQVTLLVEDDTTLTLTASAFGGAGGFTLRIERLGIYTARVTE